MKTKVTIERPDGSTEVVVREYIPVQMRAKATDATRQAGRGEIIGWEYVEEATEPVVLTEAQRARADVSQLFAAAERLQDDPGEYFPALGQAKAALAAWRAQYPAEAEAERQEHQADRQAETERREREYRSSFTRRG